MIDQITENLYISDASSVLYSPGRLHELNITHVLTASAMSIPDNKKLKTIKYKFIFLIDVVTQDILAKNLLEDAIKFIEDAVGNGGTVLVHCEVGISRSVTIVAGYLMRKFKWTPEKAIVFIKQSRPIACPNSSFLKQLEIFHTLGCKANVETIVNSQQYRDFCASNGNLVQYLDHGLGTPLPSTSDDIHQIQSMDSLDQNMTPLADLRSSTNPSKRFRCQKCRRELFHDSHLMYHNKRSASFQNGDAYTGEKLEEKEKVEKCQFEYLITPMRWMNLEGSYKGKILCPNEKCRLTLGKFIWGGRQCKGIDNQNCDAHISPWIHIQKNRVDMFNVMKKQPPAVIVIAASVDEKEV